MKVLVTGGTGVIGAGLIPALQAADHQVRLLSRHANDDAKQWNGVEPFEGDISDSATLHGSASGCHAIIHVAGIASETPPDLTFERINVEGTRNILAEAARAGVARFLYVSSLGADGGTSDYHRSKLAAEGEVSASSLSAWMLVRPGAVYGPGDEVVSFILKLVRTLPLVPVIDSGDQPFQPIWFEDLGAALVAALDDRYAKQTLEVAGPEVTSMSDVIERLRTITGRSAIKLPVPMGIAELATSIAGKMTSIPIDENKLRMLREENVIRGPNGNALSQLIGAEGTPLDQGLKQLADVLPELLPEDGFGAMQHKRFWADIAGTSEQPASLMRIFRERVTEVMPIEFAAEPGAPTTVERGATMTGALPMRGNIQVRVEVADPTRVVFATVEGHPLAGIVQFSTSNESGALRFVVDVYARAANVFDFVAMRTVGAPAQSANWRAVVQKMVDFSGGTSTGVEESIRTLEDEEAVRVEKGVRSMVQTRQRDESSAPEHSA